MQSRYRLFLPDAEQVFVAAKVEPSARHGRRGAARFFEVGLAHHQELRAGGDNETVSAGGEEEFAGGVGDGAGPGVDALDTLGVHESAVVGLPALEHAGAVEAVDVAAG